MPFKVNAERRHHIPKQRHRVTNSVAYDSTLRQRGSLMVWLTTTLSRRAESLDVVRPRPDTGSIHLQLLVDPMGLKLCGSGEWLLEKHGTKTRRSWRKLYIAVDADSGRIAAAALGKASGYNRRALVEGGTSRFKRVIGAGLQSRTGQRRATEVGIAINTMNRMFAFGRPEYVRLQR